jgi:hypothetical protein
MPYLDKKYELSERLWYAANSAYTKLTKYYTKISSGSFAIATVLDPRYKLDVYDTTQDPIALKESAKVSIKIAYENYFKLVQLNTTSTQSVESAVTQPPAKKQKRFIDSQLCQVNELTSYLQESRYKSNTDPLQYWRLNKERFPILARMARDYLALQPTSKDVEGNFSKGRRTIPYYRRSQNASSIRNQMLVNSGYNLCVFT